MSSEEFDRPTEQIARKMSQWFKGWDDIKLTIDCRHCNGTGMFDDYNECGFCTNDINQTTPKEGQ